MEFPYGIGDDDNPAVKQLKVAIESALYEADVDLDIPGEYTGVRGFYDHNIKINKIAYLAIEEKNLSIVRTWYKYGQYEPYRELRPKSLTPRKYWEEKEYAFSGGKRAVTVEDIEEFLLSLDLESLFQQDLFDFLIQNYEDFAPRRYKKTYLASTRILRAVEPLWWSDEDALLENIHSHRERFKQASIDLRYEVEKRDEFSDGLGSHVKNSLVSFEDALIGLEDSKDPNHAQIRTVRNIRRLYHERVLPWIGMVISLNEMKGPEDELDEFEEEGTRRLSDMQSDFPMQMQGFETSLEDVGLADFVSSNQALLGPGPKALQDLEQAALSLPDE